MDTAKKDRLIKVRILVIILACILEDVYFCLPIAILTVRLAHPLTETTQIFFLGIAFGLPVKRGTSSLKKEGKD